MGSEIIKKEKDDIKTIRKQELLALEELYNILVKEQKEHIMEERRKIRKQYPRLEPLVGLAAPELDKLIKKIRSKIGRS